MFAAERWAEAFVNSLDKDAEEGLVLLKILIDWIKKLPGAVFGTASARQAEKAIMAAGAGNGFAGTPCFNKTSRFVILLTEKNLLGHASAIIPEIEKLLDRKKNIVSVILESAMPAEKEFREKLVETVKKNTGAVEVRLAEKTEPRLLGGYRLIIGDKIFDASIAAQIKDMETALAAYVPAGLAEG